MNSPFAATSQVEPARRIKTALFVDFDNIYVGLDKIDPEAAQSFATYPARWLAWIEQGMPSRENGASAQQQQRAILIRGRNADELHMRNHGESSSYASGRRNGLLYHYSFRYYSGHATVSSRCVRRGHLDGGSREPRSPAVRLSRLPAPVAPVGRTTGGRRGEPSGDGDRHRPFQERRPGRHPDPHSSSSRPGGPQAPDRRPDVCRAEPLATVTRRPGRIR